jgi:hypothetical protein
VKVAVFPALHEELSTDISCSNRLIYLVSGKVNVHFDGPHHSDQLTLRDGDYIGDMAILGAKILKSTVHSDFIQEMSLV